MRRAGVLLHLTSLPSPGPIGDLGPAAWRFLEWLADAGCSSWQILPVNVMGPGSCPYASPSAFAAEPALVSVELLIRDGLLPPMALPPASEALDARAVDAWKRPLIDQAAAALLHREGEAVDRYAEDQPWASDWALYAALREELGGGWQRWPRGLARRDPDALARARKDLSGALRLELARQLLFDRQMAELRRRADALGVELIGDVPIFVSGDGCDTWAHQELFCLDEQGEPTVRAGVPPDYFSPTGQLWGNPLYDWEAHATEGYRWWRRRIHRVLRHVHRVRLDHFRGFAACWAIPADADSAMEGAWTPGPDRALFDALGPVPLIAEDLGVITPAVEALREAIGAPGMKVLQFAFEGDPNHPFLPHAYEGRRWVVYTGTHDNETTRGWYEGASEEVKHRLRIYAGRDGQDPAWDMIRLAWASVADDAIAPLQDVLDLGNEARMNVPGVAEGNWTWRTGPLPWWAARRLRELSATYGRLPGAAGDGAPG